MIDRYSLPEMSVLFTDQARLALWLDVEILAVEAWASLGVESHVLHAYGVEQVFYLEKEFEQEGTERTEGRNERELALVDDGLPPAKKWGQKN